MIFAAYCCADASILQHGFIRGNIHNLIEAGMLHPEIFRAHSDPKDVFELHRKEDIDALMKNFLQYGCIMWERICRRISSGISAYSMAVLDKCREKGIRIAVATARSEKEAEPYIKQIRPDITVSNGGARVRYGEKTVWTCKLSADATAAIVSAAVREDHCVNITVDTEDGFYVTWDHPDSPTHAHGIHRDFTNPFRKAAYKLVLELNEAEAAGRITQGHSECSMTPFSDEKWYRFAHKDATKMEGVRQAAQYLDIDVSQIAAFGDDTSDLDMIRGCGIGVAMGNAIDAVRAAADTVCLSCDEDGVARWIEENIL